MSILNDELKDLDVLKTTTFAKTMSFFGVACLKMKLSNVSEEDIYSYIEYCEKWIKEQNNSSLSDEFTKSFDTYIFVCCKEFLNKGNFSNTDEMIGYVSHFMKLLERESDAIVQFSITQILSYCITESYDICLLVAKEKVDSTIQNLNLEIDISNEESEEYISRNPNDLKYVPKGFESEFDLENILEDDELTSKENEYDTDFENKQKIEQENFKAKEENQSIERTNSESITGNTSISISKTIKFCRKCGNKLVEGSIFCNKCGTKI